MGGVAADGRLNPALRFGGRITLQINPGQADMIAVVKILVGDFALLESLDERSVVVVHFRIIRYRTTVTHLQLIFSIHRATHRIGLFIQRHDPDLTQAEAHILCNLIESGDASVADLHRAFAHRRSTLTSVLDRLVARRLVTREPSQTDRRSFVIGLTRAGRTKAARIHRLLESLEVEELRDFGQIVRRLERAETG